MFFLERFDMLGLCIDCTDTTVFSTVYNQKSYLLLGGSSTATICNPLNKKVSMEYFNKSLNQKLF